ncbi:MAG: hypothetical protein ACRCXM_05500, partial [Beijerinckiaceae bacterium]
ALGAGMLSHAAYTVVSGKQPPKNVNEWVKEGMSKSGVLGIIDDMNNIAAKATGNRADMYRLIGAERPMARFSSQSFVANLLGPTAGKLETLAKIPGAMMSEKGWDARTTQAARQFVPFQNLWAIRRGLNEVEDSINRSFGITPLERK